MLIGLLRYAQVIERHQNCVLNTAGLCTCWICAAGLLTAGNFQLDYAKILHYVGAGVAFTCSMLFVSLQTALTYRLAKTQHEYLLGHIRLTMSLLTFMALVLGGGFFCVETSFLLQHISAVLEWVFCMLVMLFYGTFAFEFSVASADTLVVLSRGGGAVPRFADPAHHHHHHHHRHRSKLEESALPGCYPPPDSLAMLYPECDGGGEMTSQHITLKLAGGGD
ncbi:hypothetical protein NHX12_025417 [Muraenolepis orangiensis]|uniref:CWH43-like N-terminal domain-containing protein n=1 Tax=Muraenolepis orangiensis TaxID=630683 RepID=A0A9Q0EJZ2_9TELE|nr:hypothetical protein NHX12_025417 [Muraenolepis orangiensis]